MGQNAMFWGCFGPKKGISEAENSRFQGVETVLLTYPESQNSLLVVGVITNGISLKYSELNAYKNTSERIG